MYNNKKQHKNHTKTQFPKKKNNSSWGLTHPRTSFFSDFWIYFNLTKTLRYAAIDCREYWITSKVIFSLSNCPLVNPLGPHDALKHHFTYLKTDLISLQLGVLERMFPSDWFTNTWQFSLLFHPHQIIYTVHPLQVDNCDSNSQLAVDVDDNGKFRLERVKAPAPIMFVCFTFLISILPISF